MEQALEQGMRLISCVQEKIRFRPRVALVLGSGLGDFVQKTEVLDTLSYADIPGFPVSTVAGHAGRFVFCRLHGIDLVCMQGRVHYYEGYSMQQVVMPIRLMRLMGASVLVLTNAAGGVSLELTPGDLMMLTGHIASFVPSPLVGPNSDALGTRFPDMSCVYDLGLRDLLRQSAAKRGLALREGVYLQVSGPQYETPEEIRMYGMLGADAVGMSTAAEAIAARHAGMRVCGISCITNLAAGLSPVPLSHREVQETSHRVAESFSALLDGFFACLAHENRTAF